MHWKPSCLLCLFKKECRLAGKQEPRSDGVVIFDEVKVASQLMWNSRSHQLMGLAMTHKDLPSLDDVYVYWKNQKLCSKQVQFLRCDTTPEEAVKTSKTLEYLKACHYLFKRGFLSYERVRSLNSDVIKNKNKGLHYYFKWPTDLIEQSNTMQCLMTTWVYAFSKQQIYNSHTLATRRRSFYLAK